MYELLDLYPPFGLIVTTPRLVLRVPESDETIARLATVAAGGVHDPSYMPFGTPWTDGTPLEVAQRAARNAWKSRDQEGAPNAWNLLFAVRLRETPEEPIGIMGLHAKDYTDTATVETGSWLGIAHHRKGYGAEMRAAVLALAFGGLGARRATTSAFEHNSASLGVTTKLGYTHTHDIEKENRGEQRRLMKFEMTKENWVSVERAPVTWTGLEPVLEFLQLPPRVASDGASGR